MTERRRAPDGEDDDEGEDGERFWLAKMLQRSPDEAACVYKSNEKERLGYEDVADVIWYDRVGAVAAGDWMYTKLSDWDTLSVSTFIVVDEWKTTGVPLASPGMRNLRGTVLKKETRDIILAVGAQ